MGGLRVDVGSESVTDGRRAEVRGVGEVGPLEGARVGCWAVGAEGGGGRSK